MQAHLDDLKLKQICPILAENKWNYLDLALDQELFHECCMQIMGWYARRGNRLSSGVLYTVLEQILQKKNVNPIETDVVDAVKDFTNSKLYKKIEHPVMNTEIQLKMNNVVMKYDVPILTKYNDTHYAILFDQTITDKNDLSKSLEAKFIAVWAFYVLNTYINIYSIKKVGKKTEAISMKATQSYLMEAKKNILSMEYLAYNNYKHTAHHLVCQRCSRRESCQIKQT